MESISPQYRDAFPANQKGMLNCKLPVINLFLQSIKNYTKFVCYTENIYLYDK